MATKAIELLPKRVAAAATAMPDMRAMQKLDNQLCFALYSSSLMLTRLYKPLLGAFGLTYPQYLVMLALWETDGVGVGELGERLFLDSGTLTPLLKRMEAAGLLIRARAAEDERRVIVTLTAAGRALRRRAEHLPMALGCATGCKLDQIAKLTAQLQALRTHVAGHIDPMAA
jgi:MarR family transcriptional regulator, organic hydroperoxide resistance regulator